MLWKDINGRISETPSIPWDDTWLSKVDWQTLHILKGAVFEPITITTAQVLQQIGCQHAARQKKICIDYPWMLQKKGVLQKKEMKSAIEMSQINLTLRADYLIKGLKPLEAALEIAAKKNVRILLSSIGFESFDDTILKNLNKGLDKQTNLDAIKAIRKLKSRYPSHLGYLKQEGANHGFIHPTPWDNKEISHEINKTISMYQLSADILPHHSTPLIIHHASGLADWIRQIEEKENIEFQRVGTTIGWWQTKGQFLL